MEVEGLSRTSRQTVWRRRRLRPPSLAACPSILPLHAVLLRPRHLRCVHCFAFHCISSLWHTYSYLFLFIFLFHCFHSLTLFRLLHTLNCLQWVGFRCISPLYHLHGAFTRLFPFTVLVASLLHTHFLVNINPTNSPFTLFRAHSIMCTKLTHTTYFFDLTHTHTSTCLRIT